MSMKFVIQIIVSALAVLISSYLLPGVEIDSATTALLVAAVLSFLNTILKPIMVLLTIPITIISLGLFLFVINAFIILITAKLVDGFSVNGFWYAFLFSLILSFITSILNGIQAKSSNRENE